MLKRVFSILSIFSLYATASYGEVCYTSIQGRGGLFVEENNSDVVLERLSCQQKSRLTTVLSATAWGLGVTGTVCTLVPHPAIKVVGVVVDIHGVMLGALEMYVNAMDCKDDYATRKKAFEEICWDLRANGMNQLDCRNVKVQD
jgi:hypothetical protein